MNFADEQTSASPAFHLLLQLLHFLAYVSSYHKRLAHLGEERGHLVRPQEAGSPALQHVQETRFHNPCERGRKGGRQLWAPLSFSLLSAEYHLLTPTGMQGSQENGGRDG